MMDSWVNQTASPAISPAIKSEAEPDNLPMAPDGMFSPLCSGSVDPVDIMTPQSHDSPDYDASASSPYDRSSETPAKDQQSASDKKQAKKRKSWGQVLPEPKTNLPPRKRAKTEDEKEQRRVERVLRNRKAAQSSRERKRQEVEALELRNQELQDQLTKMEQVLRSVIKMKNGADPQTYSGVDQAFRSASSPTLTPELFGSQNSQDPVHTSTESKIYDEIMDALQPNKTVNPASLSPAMSPAAEEDDYDDEAEPAPAANSAAEAYEVALASTDSTQHPAVSVGGNYATSTCDLSNSVSIANLPGGFASHYGNDSLFDVPAPAFDTGALYEGFQLADSPESSNFDDDPVVGNFDEFINTFVHFDKPALDPVTAADDSPADDPYFTTFFDSEAQDPSEDTLLQPRIGASS